MPGVYSLSTTVEITFTLPNLHLKKLTKNQLNFSNSIFCFMWKTKNIRDLSSLTFLEKLNNFSSFFFFLTYHFQKYFIKAFYCLIIKVPYKVVLLSIITCRHLSLTYHTQKYFIKALYYLAKTWLCVTNVTYHSQKRILSLFYYVKFPFDMWNKQRIKSTQKQQTFCKTCCKLIKNTLYT